ncbi:MAG: Rpn family recombination-promoting nuclease/putative transposase [Bacilli bacterium]|nr:Rpn family recombination-promoting nuclease/putative transposase [Bacilli bacterium]
MTENIEFIKASNDGLFKTLFGNEKNRDILEKLIEETLKRKIKVKELLMQDVPKDRIEEKDKTLDVLVSADGEKINIELNMGVYDGLYNRNACYIFGKYVGSVKAGGNYKNMDNFIQINLTSRLPKEKPMISKYELIEVETKERFIKNLEIYEFNLDKIKEMCYNEGKKEYKILAALMCDKEELHNICKGDKVLEKLESEVVRMNEDDQIRENLLAIENAKRVHATLMENAKEEGLAMGIEQGSKLEKIEIAKNMLKKSMDISVIVEITGLDKETVENLK